MESITYPTAQVLQATIGPTLKGMRLKDPPHSRAGEDKCVDCCGIEE